ncbi:putative fibroblast growth factor 1 isoform X2 [Solea solea]|uniref:putative fibroblast growth factor 1 isoform X2 n=1 Tax=Solea solea TaxID=90069 RepID=UPI00272AE373|nr:putative fibroblast growth factor 1 isoform X2 [Solea solea]
MADSTCRSCLMGRCGATGGRRRRRRRMLTVRPQHSHRAAHSHPAVLKIKAVDRGVVVIQGTEAGRYLAMSDEGLLYSSPTVTDESYFLEKLEENHYNTYQAQKYQERGWYVALKKNGKPKAGPRTHIGQKAVFFLPRQLDGSGE